MISILLGAAKEASEVEVYSFPSLEKGSAPGNQHDRSAVNTVDRMKTSEPEGLENELQPVPGVAVYTFNPIAQGVEVGGCL